jgi:uncharacterized membrane protein YkvA (DUF1232 family)
MYEDAFVGLGISNAEGVALLRHTVDALGSLIQERMREPGAVPDRTVRLASGGLAYFVIGKDLVPDDAPGGLVDDLAILGTVLSEVNPPAAAGLPMDKLRAVLERHNIPPLTVADHPFLSMAALAHPTTVLQKARAKLQNLPQEGAAQGTPQGKRGNPSAAQLYMGMMMMAYWASQKSPRKVTKPARKRRSFE